MVFIIVYIVMQNSDIVTTLTNGLIVLDEKLWSESPRNSQSYKEIDTNPQSLYKYVRDGNETPENLRERKIQLPSKIIGLYVRK